MLLPLEGRRLVGKFRFLSSLGSGGMASVYLAVNELVDREVAIKFLRPEVGRDPEAVARFRSEAKAAGRIGNAHICEILDFGESPIGPYIVMERLRGIDLAALIRRQTRLAPGYAVRVVRHALEGLAAAHEAGIVHRDLKPANVFLHRTANGETTVKLMDFGVSKFLDGTGEAETVSGILLGTPEYMAPEQLEGAHKIGPPADIWAMGAILYRGITGHQVFSGPNLAAVLRSMALDEVTPVSQLVSGLPPELEAVIHRCLAGDVGARYPSAQALSAALEPFEALDIEVVPLAVPAKIRAAPISSSDPPDAPTHVWKEAEAAEVAAKVVPRKRGRLWAASGLLVLAALALGVALAFGPGRTESEPGEPRQLAGSEAVEAPAAGDGGEVEPVEPVEPVEDTGATETGDPAEQLMLDDPDPEADDEGDDDAGPQARGTDRPPPAGTLRAGAYITPRTPGSAVDFISAKRHCEGLASKSYAGVSGWALANPSQLRKFIGNNQVKRSRYWTSAVHDGHALVFTLAAGKKSSEKIDRKIARPLCVTKY